MQAVEEIRRAKETYFWVILTGVLLLLAHSLAVVFPLRWMLIVVIVLLQIAFSYVVYRGIQVIALRFREKKLASANMYTTILSFVVMVYFGIRLGLSHGGVGQVPTLIDYTVDIFDALLSIYFGYALIHVAQQFRLWSLHYGYMTLSFGVTSCAIAVVKILGGSSAQLVGLVSFLHFIELLCFVLTIIYGYRFLSKMLIQVQNEEESMLTTSLAGDIARL